MDSISENKPLPSVFTDMLRSFVVLGRNLNLTRTVRELNITRQTIHRHIKELEALKGAKLFEMVDREYRLTDAGKASYPAANKILQLSADWAQLDTPSPDGMVRMGFSVGENGWFYAQQHPLNQIWSIAPPLLQRGLKDWGLAGAELEHQSLRKIRPYTLVYRQHGDDWLCIDVGEKSSYATWMGLSHARSNIGRALSVDPAFAGADKYMTDAYRFAADCGGHWYDHVCARFPRRDGGKARVVNYQRLVSACRFPDGEPAIMVLVARTNAITVDGLDRDSFQKMPEKEVMEFEL